MPLLTPGKGLFRGAISFSFYSLCLYLEKGVSQDYEE